MSRTSIAEALDVLRELGAVTVDLALPNVKLSIPVYYVIAPAEASSNLSRFDGVRYGHRAAAYADLADMYAKTRAEGFGAEVKRRILVGTYVLSHGYYDAYYLKAQQVRRLIAEDFRAAYAKCDAIAGPTAPTAAFRIGAKSDDPVEMYLNDIFTIAANLTGSSGAVDSLRLRPQRLADRAAAPGRGLHRSEAARYRPPVPAGDGLAPAHPRDGGGMSAISRSLARMAAKRVAHRVRP